MKIWCPRCEKETIYEWIKTSATSYGYSYTIYLCSEGCGRKLKVEELEDEDE